MVIGRKSISHPRKVFISVRPASAINFGRASMSSQGRGSISATSRAAETNTKSGALLRRVALSSMFTVRPQKSSMYKSTVPLESTGMSTMRSFPIPKGMSSSKVILFGTRC